MLFWIASLSIIVAYLLSNKRYKWIYIIWKTLPRDFTVAGRYIKLNLQMSRWTKKQSTVPEVFAEQVSKHPDKILFYYEDETWTFKQLDDYSNRIANFFKSQGYEKGDSVALMLENRPEYVATWLGLSKIGVITALVNTNLSSDPLVHSLNVAHCKAMIYGKDFTPSIKSILNEIKDLTLYEFSTASSVNESLPESTNFSEVINQEASTLEVDYSQISPKDKIMYVYTSGTTGLPKAAVISHTRYMYAATGIHYLTNLSTEDIYYNPLPLYHTAGGMLAVGQGIVFGLSVALRKKFSASNYWTDCKKYNCTVANYIGEICRYLLAVHKPGTVVDHPVKRMIGNGLRTQIWNDFVETFHVENVHEFYGSTEGNSNLINTDNRIGAVGFVPRYASSIYPVTLIRCDEDTGEPIRNEDGFCIACEPNEPGIVIGKIDQKHATTEFGGYADVKATEKKLLRNVFKTGDLYFNSGDVLVQDELGYYYFRDRTGDTFRWKGENVATTEVEAVLSTVADLKDTVVYGVQIPGTEGRAGMATIVDSDNSLNLSEFVRNLKAKLPSYAIPMFLRITDSLPMTGTFKLIKSDLQKEGFNYDQIKDHRLYFFSSKVGEYAPLNKEIYDEIISGLVKL